MIAAQGLVNSVQLQAEASCLCILEFESKIYAIMGTYANSETGAPPALQMVVMQPDGGGARLGTWVDLSVYSGDDHGEFWSKDKMKMFCEEIFWCLLKVC